MLESTDEPCLAHELKLNGIAFRLQHPHPVEYKGSRLDCGYRVDVLVGDALILEFVKVAQASRLLPRKGKQAGRLFYFSAFLCFLWPYFASFICVKTAGFGITLRSSRRDLAAVKGKPAPRPGGIAVLDNLSARRDDTAIRMIERAGAQVKFLPPYSPDRNPIEQVWSKVEQLLRGLKARRQEALLNAIGSASDRVTEADAHGGFVLRAATVRIKTL